MAIFHLPDLGEGLPEAEIVEWYVAPGDTVALDQPLVAMESAKAIVEIPCPQHGTVRKLFGAVGDIVRTGDALVEFHTGEQQAGAEPTPPKASTRSNSVVGELHDRGGQIVESANAVGSAHARIKATPAVRALARKHNIDLAVVTPSGPDNTVTGADIERVAKIFAQVGELKPLRGARRAMALTMVQAHAEVVPVSLHDDADITHWPADADITLRMAEAIIAACRAEPSLNSWYDNHAVGRRLLDSVHLGIAVDTEECLFVPVLEDAQLCDGKQLSEKMAQLVAAVRSRTIAAAQLRGSTITLSNYGNIGGKYATPVVVPPTVAIVAVGRAFPQVLQDPSQDGAGQMHQHTLLPLSLTFDHRAVTGGEAARFMNALRAALESYADT